MILKFDIFIRQGFDNGGYSVSTYREFLKSNSEIAVDNTSVFLSLIRNGAYVDYSLSSLMCQCKFQIVGRMLACRFEKEFPLSFYFRDENDRCSITPCLVDKNNIECKYNEQILSIEQEITIDNNHTVTLLIPLINDCVVRCDGVEYTVRRGELIMISALENEYTLMTDSNLVKQFCIQ